MMSAVSRTSCSISCCRARWTSQPIAPRAPNYATGVTTLTPEFFAEVNDNARVTLTFHYWSGAVVTYHVTRSGSAVTGSSGS